MAERKQSKKQDWLKIGLIALAFLAVSIGLAYLIRLLLAGFQIPQNIPTWLAMLIVFGVVLVVNLSAFIPLPFGVALMLAAASIWNPILVALVASLGGSLGEFSSYFFGYLGKRFAISTETPGYKLVQDWIRRYGMWAIALLSFQPIIPFEIGGFIAGIARMPIPKFLPAIFIGKFPKYLILIYLGGAILRLFPSFLSG